MSERPVLCWQASYDLLLNCFSEYHHHHLHKRFLATLYAIVYMLCAMAIEIAIELCIHLHCTQWFFFCALLLPNGKKDVVLSHLFVDAISLLMANLFTQHDCQFDARIFSIDIGYAGCCVCVCVCESHWISRQHPMYKFIRIMRVTFQWKCNWVFWVSKPLSKIMQNRFSVNLKFKIRSKQFSAFRSIFCSDSIFNSRVPIKAMIDFTCLKQWKWKRKCVGIDIYVQKAFCLLSASSSLFEYWSFCCKCLLLSLKPFCQHYFSNWIVLISKLIDNETVHV